MYVKYEKGNCRVFQDAFMTNELMVRRIDETVDLHLKFRKLLFYPRPNGSSAGRALNYGSLSIMLRKPFFKLMTIAFIEKIMFYALKDIRMVHENCFWWSRQESNLHLKFRKLLFYPRPNGGSAGRALNYGSLSIMLRKPFFKLMTIAFIEKIMFYALKNIRMVHENCFWWSRQESNLHLKFRKLLFYPRPNGSSAGRALNYGSLSIMLRKPFFKLMTMAFIEKIMFYALKDIRMVHENCFWWSRQESNLHLKFRKLLFYPRPNGGSAGRALNYGSLSIMLRKPFFKLMTMAFIEKIMFYALKDICMVHENCFWWSRQESNLHLKFRKLLFYPRPNGGSAGRALNYGSLSIMLRKPFFKLMTMAFIEKIMFYALEDICMVHENCFWWSRQESNLHLKFRKLLFYPRPNGGSAGRALNYGSLSIMLRKPFFKLMTMAFIEKIMFYALKDISHGT